MVHGHSKKFSIRHRRMLTHLPICSELIMKSVLKFDPAIVDLDSGVAAAATLLVTLGGLISLSLLVALLGQLLGG
jgi:hypothetical protein